MAVVVSAVWFTQFFLAGLRLFWVAAGMAGGVAGLVGAYLTLPHVASRIDRFLDPASGDSYQVERSMDAFMNGGLWGRGPGEGTVKGSLPDAHADFVFAVAGEELGLVLCLAIVALYRLLRRVRRKPRLAFLLHYVYGMTRDEVADALTVSLSTVKRLIAELRLPDQETESPPPTPEIEAFLKAETLLRPQVGGDAGEA